MRWMPRLRMFLARRPWIYWLIVAGVAGGLAVSVAGAVADVGRERDSWGETVSVWVASSAIEPGDLIAPAADTRRLPAAMIPAGAIDHVAGSAIAKQRISAGEVIVEIDVSAAPGPLALLPTGWLAIMVIGPVNDTFTVGHDARVLAGGKIVANDAIVISVLPDGVVVGVPEDVAAHVADVATQRLAVVAPTGR